MAETTDYEIKEFDLDDLIDAMSDNIKEDVKSFDDIRKLERIKPDLNNPRILSMIIWYTY